MFMLYVPYFGANGTHASGIEGESDKVIFISVEWRSALSRPVKRKKRGRDSRNDKLWMQLLAQYFERAQWFVV